MVTRQPQPEIDTATAQRLSERFNNVFQTVVLAEVAFTAQQSEP